MNSLRSLLSGQDGQALPEYALVLPMLLVVFVGIIHFGKAFNYWNDATHIAAEGARYAAVNNKPYPANTASLQAQLQAQSDTTELRNGGTPDVSTASQVCIDFPTGTAAKGEPVRVTMRFTYNWLPLFDLDVTSTQIVSTAVMRLETAPTNYSAGCA
jgi:Flp pilus assembly protein TadG